MFITGASHAKYLFASKECLMTLTARNMRRRLIRGAKKQIRRLMRAEGRDDVENRYEVYHRRGKDYADASHER
jgi:hypothetical protein